MTGKNRRAALNTMWAIRVDEETSPADAHDILDALGLIGEIRPCSRHLSPHPDVPDDPSEDQQKLAGAGLTPINSDQEKIPPSRRKGYSTDPPPLGGRHCPPGLRALFGAQAV